MEGYVLPDFHVDFLDVEMFEGVIYQVQIRLDIGTAVEEQSYDFHQNLVAELFYHVDFNFGTLNSERFQLILPSLRMQKLLFLADYCHKFEEGLHHGLTLGD